MLPSLLYRNMLLMWTNSTIFEARTRSMLIFIQTRLKTSRNLHLFFRRGEFLPYRNPRFTACCCCSVTTWFDVNQVLDCFADSAPRMMQFRCASGIAHVSAFLVNDCKSSCTWAVNRITYNRLFWTAWCYRILTFCGIELCLLRFTVHNCGASSSGELVL